MNEIIKTVFGVNPKPMGTLIKGVFENMVSFAEKTDGFICGVRPAGIEKWLMATLFYDYGENRLRVVIENCECDCGWKRIVANPSVSGLYETLDNEFEILNKIKNISLDRYIHGKQFLWHNWLNYHRTRSILYVQKM